MSKIDLVKKAFLLAEEWKIDEYLDCFTSDAVYKIGNFPPAVGHQAIKEFSAPMMENFTKLGHDIINIWEFDNKVAAEMTLSYTRKDGKVFEIPCIDLIEFEGDKVKHLQSYIDVSPLFAP